MNLDQLPVNWFDFAVLLILLAGLMRGRKHGMSEELLFLVQWLTIIFAGAALYEPAGQALAQAPVFSRLFSYVAIYIAMAILIKAFFSLFKHGLGGKMIGSDIFGRGEYYLGMVSGLVRYGCILMFLLALLNARYFSPAEIRAMENYQKDVYGSDFFPGLHSMQVQVFEKSFGGPVIKKYLDFFLIKPTAPEKKGFKQKEWEGPEGSTR